MQPSLSAPGCSFLFSGLPLCAQLQNLGLCFTWEAFSLDGVYWPFGFWKEMKLNMFQWLKYCNGCVTVFWLCQQHGVRMICRALGFSSPSFAVMHHSCLVCIRETAVLGNRMCRESSLVNKIKYVPENV